MNQGKILFLAVALLCLLPVMPAALALFLGVILALTTGNPFPEKTKIGAQKLLMISVVGLGAGMNLTEVGKAGLRGIGYTVFTITGTLLIGMTLGRILKISKNPSLLISVGTAICGGSAIAAASAAIRAKSEETSIALGTVFMLNAAALVLFPYLGHRIHMDQTQFGLWSALAIHDTSSVVGASLQYGSQALHIGTTVKLARALWIVPLTFLIGMIWTDRTNSTGKKPKPPWFIFGFVAVAAAVTWVTPLAPAGQVIATLAKRLLVLTLFLIGVGFTKAALKNVGPRAFLQGFILWLIVAAGTAEAISKDWIHL